MKNATYKAVSSAAKAKGFDVYSTNYYNPGRRYRIGHVIEFGAFRDVAGSNMTGKEALAWLSKQ